MPTELLNAGGAIPTGRFAKINPSDSSTVVVCAAATDQPIGITIQVGSSGSPVPVAMAGGHAMLRAGSGGWTFGNMLTSDASGQGVVAANGQVVGAVALASAAAGDIGLVSVVPPGSYSTSGGGYVSIVGSQTISGSKTFSSGATFSSSPLVPTVSVGDNSTKAASTAYVCAGFAAMATGTGAPATSPSDGSLYVDTNASVLYVRTGGAWKSVALT